VLALVLLAAAGCGPEKPAPRRTVTYRASDAVLANPERGPVIFHQPEAGLYAANREPLDTPEVLAYFGRERERTGATLVRVVYTLQEWREAPIPAAFLDRIDRDFGTARSSGYKLIPYFAYNWVPEAQFDQGRDADADRIAAHLDQLRPVLHRNVDVLAFMIAGFIGPWGEWHHSTSGNRAPDESESINGATRRILDALLKAVPKERAVVLRYPQDKADLFGTEPMSPTQAFDGSPRARLGFHDESFLNNRWPDDRQQPWFHPYIDKEGLLVPQIVAFDPDTLRPGTTLSCQDVLDEVSRLHVDAMLDVEGARQLTGECAPELRRRLGYRLRLTPASAPEKVRPGQPLGLAFTVANDGVAPAYNERPVRVVLRHRDTGTVRVLATDADPRRWLPGRTTTVTVDTAVPPDLAAGTYDILLHLPDASAGLQANPAYAVRLADDTVFDERTGHNHLRLSVTVH
jgi:hypothetical protein